MKMQKKVWIILGSVSGAAALGAIGLAVWNSRTMRMMRATRRAGKILYRVGSALQSVSTLME